jgi:CheY-like chemotaxis protein/lambda repressor-like predicted transcriptional regulator
MYTKVCSEETRSRRRAMSQFVQWLKAEWETLERRRGENYSARRLSIEAGLSPNTLYQLLKRPEVKPSPETCRKLAAFFGVAPLLVLQLAGHVPSKEAAETLAEFEAALQRGDLQTLILSAKDLSPAEVQLVQQMVDQLRTKRREEEVARGAAVALVVEDTPDARAAIVDMLQAAGLKVLEATDGQRAVELIETSGALIDVVLMDYRMPRMDGVEATREIRKHFPDLPVLFVSAWDEPEMKEAAFDAGAAEYLVAPVGYDRLLEAVSRVRRGGVGK